jgi:hypothetical protein
MLSGLPVKVFTKICARANICAEPEGTKNNKQQKHKLKVELRRGEASSSEGSELEVRRGPNLKFGGVRLQVRRGPNLKFGGVRSSKML